MRAVVAASLLISTLAHAQLDPCKREREQNEPAAYQQCRETWRDVLYSKERTDAERKDARARRLIVVGATLLGVGGTLFTAVGAGGVDVLARSSGGLGGVGVAIFSGTGCFTGAVALVGAILLSVGAHRSQR